MQRDAAPPLWGRGPGPITAALRKVGMPGQARTAHGRPSLVAALTFPLCLALGACVGSPAESPFEFFRQLTGDPLQGRRTPAGLDDARPNFSAVPPRPERGPAEIRAELSATLAANRAAAANPAPVGAPVPPRPDTEGAGVVPAAPPSPARLAPAPPIGLGPATLTLPGGRGAVPTPLPDIGVVPAPPPADLTAPAPPTLSTPPPPPRL